MGTHLIDEREFETLTDHLQDGDCEVRLATYGHVGDPQNVAIECETCGVVLHDVEPETE